MEHDSQGLSIDALMSLKELAAAGRADTAALIAAHRAEICIRQYSDAPECDVIIMFRGRELSPEVSRLRRGRQMGPNRVQVIQGHAGLYRRTQGRLAGKAGRCGLAGTGIPAMACRPVRVIDGGL